jgi:hypothetical protein
MSGSPKYNAVRSGEQRRRQAERERKERERRRQEKQRKERQAALEKARKAALSRVTEVTRRRAALGPDTAATGLTELTDALAAALRLTEKAIRNAPDLDAVAKATNDLDRCERSLVDLRHQIAARQQGAAVERVEAVAQLLADVPAEARAHFDRAGSDEVEELLSRARRQVSSDPNGAVKRCDAAAEAVREHLDRVLARRAAYEARVARATDLLGDAASRLAHLEADATQARTPLPGGVEAGHAITELSAALRRGEVDRVLDALPHAVSQVDRAEQALDELIDRIVERRELLRSIINALPDAGFEVDRNSFHEGPDGALELRAHGGDGQEFAVLVREGTESQTEVLYTTDTMAHAVVAGTGGQPCPALLEVIDRLNAEARQDGFETGAVRWDDDDQPPPGGAVPLPQPGKATRRAG